MSVKLIALSQPTEISNCKTAEDLVAYCARVSNPANQANMETAPKLIKYLITNKHWSPLEMVHLTVEIETTRDIARQILRHRSFSFQEFSQRYADPTKSLGFISREARLQDTKNRQNSIDVQDSILGAMWVDKQKQIISLAEEVYNWALTNNIAKEQARAVLPEGLTVSRMYMAGSLRSFIHYCALRSGNGTQKEHKLLAREMFAIILELFPAIKEVVKDLDI